MAEDHSFAAQVDGDTLKLTGTGHLSGEAARDLLKLAQSYKGIPSVDLVLADLRAMQLTANVIEIEAFVEELMLSQIRRRCKIAVVYTPRNDAERARFRFLEIIYRMRADGLRIFTQIDQAQSWLTQTNSE